MLRTLLSYKYFILGSVQREFQARYKNSLLGAAWTIIQPLSMILVYTLIFSKIMKARLPNAEGDFAYSIYLCSGILAWGLFAEISNRSVSIFIENANLIKKIKFPKICLPVILTISATINFFIIFSIFTVFLIFSKNFPGIAYFSVIPLILITIALAIGLGMSLGVINVFFRDVSQLYAIALQFLFWLTPIVYPQSILPEKFKNLLSYNPLTPLFSSYQKLFVNGITPEWNTLIYPLFISLILCFLGYFLFKKRQNEMIDEL